jgi:hypothetical protein
MRKISSRLTILCFIFFLVGCSNPQIKKPVKEDVFVHKTQKLSNTETTEQSKPTETTEASLASELPESKRSLQNQSRQEKIYQEESDQKSAALPDKAFEREQYYIETPVKDPTVGNQSSEHENEYRPKTTNNNRTEEDLHSEADTLQTETAETQKTQKTQKPHTQRADSATEQEKSAKQSQQSDHQAQHAKKDASNNTQKQLKKHESEQSNLGKKTSAEQGDKNLTEKNISKQNEESPTIEAASQKDETDPSGVYLGEDSETHTQNAETKNHTTNHDDEPVTSVLNAHQHEGNHSGHNDHHLQSDLEAEPKHSHELKKKTTRHWNMQRMIKPIKAEP